MALENWISYEYHDAYSHQPEWLQQVVAMGGSHLAVALLCYFTTELQAEEVGSRYQRYGQ